MKLTKYYLTVILILAALGGRVFAGESQSEKRQGKKEIRQDKKELATTKTAAKRLIHNIDLWVDASLNGHDKRAGKYEQAIFELIDADIASSRRQVERYENEVRSSEVEYNQQHIPGVARRDDRTDLRDDVKDLHQALQYLRVKERLASSLRRTDAFSNKYRLFGDYTELLRHEFGLTRVELAEDVKELHEDRVEGRRE
jgi:hypothetical protein